MFFSSALASSSSSSPSSSCSHSNLPPAASGGGGGGGVRTLPGVSEPGRERRRRGCSSCMSAMAWYPLPQSGSALSAGDEFFENQSAGWSLWSFGSSDDHNNTHPAPVYPVKQESGEDGAARSEEQSVQTPMEPQPCTPLRTDDIFLSQFSDEEMRRMDAISFETLDMFPGYMHRLLSYEDMLSGVLTGVVSSEDQEAASLDRDGVDAMDTCGFPLFSHDLQQDAEHNGGEGTLAETLSMDEAGMGTVKRSRSFADGEGAGGFEALVLEELEDVVFQLTKKTRICFRDAFFRMAETLSKASCAGGGASGAAAEVVSGSGSGRQSVRQAGCPERETNAIDRTVADLTMRPPCPAPLEVHGSCCAGGSGAAAQPTASWTTRA